MIFAIGVEARSLFTGTGSAFGAQTRWRGSESGAGCFLGWFQNSKLGSKGDIMVMVKESGSHYETPEAGTYPATCSRVIDLGTQENEYKGEKIKKRQVIISWELSEKMTTGEPFLIGQFYTASLSEKSKLRPMLESWRGAAFTSEELEGFDLSKLIGKSCLVSLIKNEKGKTKVSSVSKLPKGIEGPALTGKTVHFDLDKFDKSVFDSLPNKIKEMIEKSPEYDLVAAGHVKSEAVEEEEPVRGEGETEEVPF